MTKMLLLFSHELTTSQIEDAKATLEVTEFVHLLPDLVKLWKNVPPMDRSITAFLDPFREWIRKHAVPNDYVLIQGDYGATFHMVNFAFTLDLIPVYSTSIRQMAEKNLSNNSVQIERLFKHRIFRRFEKELSE